MKGIQQGFTLYELLIYLTVGTIITFYITRLLTITIPYLKKEKQNSHEALDLYLVSKSIKSYLCNAPGNRMHWHCAEPQELSWHEPDQDISIQVKAGKLIFLYGTYDQTNKKMIKKEQVILCDMIEGEFRLIEQDKSNYLGIECRLKKGNHEVTLLYAFLNGKT